MVDRLVSAMRSADETLDETQPTQLLRDVLEPPSKGMKSSLCNAQQETQINGSPSSTPSAPCFNLHGLADTQPDSQRGLDELAKKDSGMSGRQALSVDSSECYGRSDVRTSAIHTVSPSRVPVIERINGKKDANGLHPQSFGSPTSGIGSTPQSRADVSRNVPLTSRYVQRPQRPRSLSPPSQESFASPLPPDEQAKAFMRDSPTFNVPVDKLGQTQQSDSFSQTSSYVALYEGDKNVPADTQPDSQCAPGQGTLLVASTPSISSQSTQSQPQGQGRGEIPDGQGLALHSIYGSQDELRDSSGSNQDYESTQPSSSYIRMFAGDYEDVVPTQISPIPTQLLEVEETQVIHETPPPALPELSTAGQSYTTATTTRKGLMSLVNPAKHWRFSRAPEPHAELPTYFSDTQLDTTGNATAGDTQRDLHLDTDHSSPPLSPVPSPPAIIRRPPSRIIRKETDEMEVDVIPDSEATQPNSSPLPSHTPRPDPPPKAAKNGRRNDPSITDTEPEDDSVPLGLIIPDCTPPALHARKEEEESSEEDEDVPLAKAVKPKSESRVQLSSVEKASEVARPAVDMPPPKTIGRQKEPSAATTKVKRRRLNDLRPPDVSAIQNSYERTVIPSSAPDQDAMVDVKDKATSKRPSKSRSASHSSKASSKVVTPIEAHPSEVQVESNLQMLSEVADQATEVAEDESMDADDMEESVALSTTTRKRKRGAPASRASKGKKSSATRSKTSSTPQNRPTKRLKSASVTKSSVLPATRVFALWKADNCYYSGVVHSVSEKSSNKFLVKFDDNAEEVVDVSKMRLCQPKVGDSVLFHGSLKGKISEVSGGDPHDTVVVENDSGAEIAHYELIVKEIKVASRALQFEWKDRALQAEDIIPIVRPKIKNSPTPSRTSIASGSSSNTRKILVRTGIVISQSPGNDSSKKVEWLTTNIKSRGGTIVEDWGHVLDMEGKHSMQGKRWIIQHSDVRLLKQDLDRIFLLSDDATHKPKFLIALALGVPCLSLKWLDMCFDENKELPWQPYLLPAGLCEQLNARMSQLVDYDWGNSPQYLKEMLNDGVPAKVFSKKSILCLHPDFVPPPKNGKRGNCEGKPANASCMIPRIVLCMGASRVEAIPEAKFASQDMEEYDYVIVKEEHEVGPIVSRGANCVPFSWVKECLIASRLLPQNPV
ncbi:hypothetical protein K474DRAFT_1654725 [Panus rudis PR-1116 ss-1]|nr:hypothetical protein K474DRAFT_1654725 [Panus rudis PR-1116 ss-1]